tara:strand:- start:695 stop:889 length:195 start_codon:yes stop_codon:yes gene_type:complete
MDLDTLVCVIVVKGSPDRGMILTLRAQVFVVCRAIEAGESVLPTCARLPDLGLNDLGSVIESRI